MPSWATYVLKVRKENVNNFWWWQVRSLIPILLINYLFCTFLELHNTIEDTTMQYTFTWKYGKDKDQLAHDMFS
jgi:hypothetical protein